MTADDVARLIERYNEAWNRQDLDAIHALHHADVVFCNHTAGESAEGAAAVREHIAGIFAGNPGMRFRTRSLRTADDFAVCEWTLTDEENAATAKTLDHQATEMAKRVAFFTLGGEAGVSDSMEAAA